MGLLTTHLILALCMSIILTFYGLSFADKTCDIKLAAVQFTCSPNETCMQKEGSDSEGVCHCLQNFDRDKNGSCIPSSSPVPPPLPTKGLPPPPLPVEKIKGYSFAVWIAVPCLLITVLVGLSLAARRYMWFERLYRIRAQLYNHVPASNQARSSSTII